MASSMARDGRRRRVLNDEVRTASGISLAAGATGADPNAPRYGEQAGVEHHPQVTDFVPRRKRALLSMLVATLGAAAAAQALTQFAPQIAAAVPGVTESDVSGQLAGGMTAWTSAMVLLACAGLAKVIYSLRRHRVDDYRGRYRAWRWVAWTAMAASFNAVVGLHTIVAGMARASSWSLTSTGAAWWLIPVALVAGWVFVRMVLDMAESRAALAPTMLGAACYSLAAAGALGWSPAVLGDSSGVLVNSLPLAGHALVLAGLMTFGRYVVLDVQGLIDHAPRRAAKPKKEKKPAAPAETTSETVKSPATTLPMRQAPAAQHHDYSDADDDQDEEEGSSRRLSKIDRKRLKKQNRAA